MELLGTVRDAAIEWVVQGILGSLFTEKMEAWSREVDLDGDVENLKSAMLFINTMVDDARWRKLQNEGLSRSLRDLKLLLYDAEDVMDKLDYYHTTRSAVLQGDGDGSAAGTRPMGDRASSSTLSSVAWNAAKKIVDMVLPSHRKRKREDDTLLAPESKRDVSQRINKIANQLRTAGDDVRRALQLEISPTNAMPYQSLGEPRNTRLTTSMQVEPKVYIFGLARISYIFLRGCTAFPPSRGWISLIASVSRGCRKRASHLRWNNWISPVAARS